MRRLARLLVLSLALLALALALACAKKSAPTAPAARLGPLVLSTSPAARAARAMYDSDIWAQFDRPLLASSVDSTTVFLKIDTRRIAADVNYESITRRIRVHPRAALGLNQTFTVELSPRITAQDGGTLGQTYFWQFTTNSLRHLNYDYPAVEAVEGPVSALGWSGNGPAVSNILYDVYASVDSSAVLDRRIPPVLHTPFLTFTPGVRWPLGARVYWAVDATNTASGELLAGAMSHYVILPAGTPIDSVEVNVQDYGGIQSTRLTTQLCTAAAISLGAQFNSGVRWAVSGTNANLRVADATIELWTLPALAGTIEFSQPTIWSAQNTWSACLFSYPGPPYANPGGMLAHAHASPGDLTDAVFRSDTLSGFIENMGRRNVGLGFLLRSVNNIIFESPNVGPAPRLRIRFYRLPPVALLSARRR